MLYIETSETTYREGMSVLCADDLNFKFDLKVRARLRESDGTGLVTVMNKQGSKMKGSKLDFDVLYNTYVKPLARSIARTHVSQYSTTQIRENRAKITAAIQSEVAEATSSTPVEITMVVTSNFDYPEVITQAVEKMRRREIEIQEEEAKQKMELLRADNRMKIAQKMKVVRAAEAQAESAYNTILAKSLTPAYLKMRRIEANIELYKRVGVGDKVIVTGGPPPGILLNK